MTPADQSIGQTNINENVVQEQNNRMIPADQSIGQANINENVVQEQNNRMIPADQSIGQANINENNEKNKIIKGNRCSNKREKGIKAKSSQPWEQDHLTFRI